MREAATRCPVTCRFPVGVAGFEPAASSSRSQRARTPTTTLTLSDLPRTVRGRPLASAGVCGGCYSLSYSPPRGRRGPRSDAAKWGAVAVLQSRGMGGYSPTQAGLLGRPTRGVTQVTHRVRLKVVIVVVGKGRLSPLSFPACRVRLAACWVPRRRASCYWWSLASGT
jgi:hypothetical protein